MGPLETDAAGPVNEGERRRATPPGPRKIPGSGECAVVHDHDLAALAASLRQRSPLRPGYQQSICRQSTSSGVRAEALLRNGLFRRKLLDGDDDGNSHTLGTQGSNGQVSCAGCHSPGAGFLDNRSLGEQISLAASWGRRRAPSLLDVGQAKLHVGRQARRALQSTVRPNPGLPSRIFFASLRGGASFRSLSFRLRSALRHDAPFDYDARFLRALEKRT